MDVALTRELTAAGFELIETHISMVFLSASEVFKLKRAVDLGFLDFSTREKRERACRAEVALNRRLAPDVYLGVVVLVRNERGLAFVPERERGSIADSEVIEYGVHMRRLADSTRADVLLARGALERPDLERIGALLAGFHQRCEHGAETAVFGEAACIRANVEENFAQTEATGSAFLAASEREELRAYQRAFLSEHEAAFAARIEQGAVRDGHGDLRLDHLYRQPDGSYLAIDCIEFNDRFRYADVCADLAFLTMDLRHHERADLAELLLAAYARARGDYGLYALVDFYESYRAMVRAKVEGMMAVDGALPESARERSAREARRYYVLALSAARRPIAPAQLIITFGLIASGKSTLAEALGDRLAAPILSADFTRKELLGVSPTTARPEQAFAGAYAATVSDEVYRRLFERAECVLRSGRSAILDATFRARSARERARALARRLGVRVLFVECRCAREVSFARLEGRRMQASVSDGRAEIFDAFAESFEPPEELLDSEHIVVDTGAPLADTLSALLPACGFEGERRLR